MDIEKLRQKVLNLIPPGDRRKLQVKLKYASNTDLIAIVWAWINKYSKKYEKWYYNLAKIILLETEPPVLNPNAYKEQEEEFIKAKNHNLNEFNKITIYYLKKINNLFPFDKIISSLLIMIVITEEFADSPQNISFVEFQKKVLESFLYKIIDQDRERFDI